MSFFDLPESQRYLEGGLHEQEDVAVYTWGEESYDGLGDALLEGGDDLNDETFGGTGPIGKDFDFQSAPLENLPFESSAAPEFKGTHREPDAPISDANVSSLWDSKSPFSVLPRLNSGARFTETSKPSPNAAVPTARNTQMQTGLGTQQPKIRTVEEIEAEMRAAALQKREQASKSQESPAQSFQQPPRHALTMEEVERQMRGHQISPRPSPQRAPQHAHVGRQPLPAHDRQISNSFLVDQHALQQLHAQEHQSFHERQPSNSALAELQAMQNLQARQQQSLHERQPSNPTFAELRALQLLQAQQQQIMAERAYQQHQQFQHARIPSNFSQGLSPNEILQGPQRNQVHGMSIEEHEALRQKAAQQIHEQELLEAKRRRIAMKISRMSRNNDLMTQSDKDFITRIQVSQLMMSDPYEEDFYNQIFQTLVRKRMVNQDPETAPASGVRPEGGRKGGRRQNAMQRMEAQVERIISNVKLREKEKDLHSLNHLQGVLGKTSGRSYKAAPRQLLQVGTTSALPMTTQVPTENNDDHGNQEPFHPKTTGKSVTDKAATSNGGTSNREALTKQQALVLLEKAYDMLLQTEHLRREQPPSEDTEKTNIWLTRRDEKLRELFDILPIKVPEDASVPHPLISILIPNKGKKIIPRILRLLDKGHQLELLLAIVKNISQLDVVAKAHLLDGKDETSQRKELELQTQSFMNNVFNGFLPLLMELTFTPVNHLLSILLERANIVQLALSRPGIALLTAVFTQVAHIKHAISLESDKGVPPPLNDINHWQLLYDHFFRILNSHLLDLFPSTRMAHSLPFGTDHYVKPSPLIDAIDQPVWNFLAAFAVHASLDQQQVLVTVLRDKVLENVISANKGWNSEENERRIANVNLFLNALGLDSSQIAL